MLTKSASLPAAAISALTSSTWANAGPEVEVDAADPVARLRERDRRRLAHPARGTEDERPALAVVGHRILLVWLPPSPGGSRILRLPPESSSGTDEVRPERSGARSAATGHTRRVRLELTKRGDYAIRAILALARAPRETLLSVRRIAEEMAIPRQFLPQVMADLGRAGLVEAVPGRAGGYRIARSPAEIAILDVVEAVEGDSRRRSCVLRGGPCNPEDTCDVHDVFVAGQNALLETLAAATLAGLPARRGGMLAPCSPHAVPTRGGMLASAHAVPTRGRHDRATPPAPRGERNDGEADRRRERKAGERAKAAERER